MEIILALISLLNFGCFIYVLIKLFSQEGAMKGIFGLICSLYTFIWGWQNADTLDIRNVMMAWSVCIVLGIVGGAMFGSAAG